VKEAKVKQKQVVPCPKCKKEMPKGKKNRICQTCFKDEFRNTANKAKEEAPKEIVDFSKSEAAKVMEASEPHREAAIAGKMRLEANENEPRKKLLLEMWSNDTQVGWAIRVNMGDKQKPSTFYLFPKHFLSEEKFPNLVMRCGKQSVKIPKSEVVMSDYYDFCTWQTTKCTMGHIAPWTGEMNLKSQTALLIKRNEKMYWSSTDELSNPNSQDGEILYRAPSDLGDCGSAVWQNDRVVGIHVGTLGENKANKFLPMALIEMEIRRRPVVN
jgi:hypothetical protein